MALEVPELAERDARDIDDVGAQGDGRAGVVAIRELGAERLDEACEVFIEGEQAQEFRGRLAVGVRSAVGRVGGFLVGGDGLGVEVADLEQIERNTPGDSCQRPVVREGGVRALGCFVMEPTFYLVSQSIEGTASWVSGLSQIYHRAPSGVSSAYQPPALFVCVEIDRIVEDAQVIGGPPVFRLLKLVVGILDNPSSSTEEAPMKLRASALEQGC